jgi:Family of unknown function (DUF6308)
MSSIGVIGKQGSGVDKESRAADRVNSIGGTCINRSPEPGEAVKFCLPKALQEEDDTRALELLGTYYKARPGTPLGAYYSGARFDGWDSLGCRAADVDRFTADDLVAVTFLGVAVPPKPGWALLCGRPEYFCELLREIEDQELAAVSPGDINSQWPAWRLWERLRELPGIDWVIASKLLARKRPHLIPVYDRIVKSVTGGDRDYWTPLCEALRADDNALQHRLLRLRTAAVLPLSVTALRIFDVIAWMEGKEQGL